MGQDRIRFDIASINYRALRKMINSVILGAYSDTSPLSPTTMGEEYFQVQRKGATLLKEILSERKEMIGYVLCSLQRGGYYHRMICELFDLYSFEISFPDERSVVITSSYKAVVYRNGLLQLFIKPNDETVRN